jgi:hypothetical protein
MNKMLKIAKTIALITVPLVSGKALRANAEASADSLSFQTQNKEGSLFIQQADAASNKVMNDFYHNNPQIQYYTVRYSFPNDPSSSPVTFSSDLCTKKSLEDGSEYCGVRVNAENTIATVDNPYGGVMSFFAEEALPTENLVGTWKNGNEIIKINSGSIESGFMINDYILSSTSSSGYACYMGGDRFYSATKNADGTITLANSKKSMGTDGESIIFDGKNLIPNIQKPNFYGDFVMGDCISIQKSQAATSIFSKEMTK